MGIWDFENSSYILDYWGASSIGWQQKNRDILNNTIRVYNNYVYNRVTLDVVIEAVQYAETILKYEHGTYMDDIDIIKKNVEEIENKKFDN